MFLAKLATKPTYNSYRILYASKIKIALWLRFGLVEKNRANQGHV